MNDRPFIVSRFLLKISAVLGVLLLFVLPLWGRCLVESHSGLVAGREALASGRSVDAILLFGRALRWRAPANPYAMEAEQELLKLEEQLQGDELVTLLRERRRALHLSRSWHLPAAEEESEIVRIDSRLEALHARTPSLTGSVARFTPPYRSYALSQFFFWSWIVLVLVTISVAFVQQGYAYPRRLVWLGGSSLLMFVLWLQALG